MAGVYYAAELYFHKVTSRLPGAGNLEGKCSGGWWMRGPPLNLHLLMVFMYLKAGLPGPEKYTQLASHMPGNWLRAC